MVLKDLGNEKGSHVMCLNSLFDRYKVSLFAKPIYYCTYSRIPYMDLDHPNLKSMDMVSHGKARIRNG